MENAGRPTPPQETRETQNPVSPSGARPWGMEMNSFLTLLHLSQLAGWLAPLAGLILPLVMWLTNREEFPEVDRHGKMVMNWIISMIIYLVISLLLTLLLIGLPLLIAVAVMSIVFPIVGAVQASQGELWNYPLAIRFIQ